MKNIYYSVLFPLILFFPLTVSAQGNLFNLFDAIIGILDLLVSIIIGLALVFFLWGVAKFILNSDDPKKVAEGKQVMIWGIIALFVMVSVWGIVNFMQEALFGPEGPEEDLIYTEMYSSFF